jgi:hypothetical protein
VATNDQTRGQHRKGKTHLRKKPMALIPCEKSMGPLTLLKNALRKKGRPWLIKCSDEENLSNVRHFNIFKVKNAKLGRKHTLRRPK